MSTSKMRQVDTRFWTDTWVRRLNALDRYVFLYFLTCPHSTWCGAYEVDLSMIAFETGVDERDLTNAILPRLSPKILYIDGWVYVRNFEKYHSNRSEKTQKGIENAWMSVPEEIRLKIREITGENIPPARGIGGVSPSSSSFTSSSSLSSASKERTPETNAREFFNNEERQQEVITFLVDQGMSPTAAKSEVRKFVSYWTEPNKSGTRVRWEQQQTFELRRRLSTWLEKAKSFTRDTSNQIAEI